MPGTGPSPVNKFCALCFTRILWGNLWILPGRAALLIQACWERCSSHNFCSPHVSMWLRKDHWSKDTASKAQGLGQHSRICEQPRGSQGREWRTIVRTLPLTVISLIPRALALCKCVTQKFPWLFSQTSVNASPISSLFLGLPASLWFHGHKSLRLAVY